MIQSGVGGASFEKKQINFQCLVSIFTWQHLAGAEWLLSWVKLDVRITRWGVGK